MTMWTRRFSPVAYDVPGTVQKNGNHFLAVQSWTVRPRSDGRSTKAKDWTFTSAPRFSDTGLKNVAIKIGNEILEIEWSVDANDAEAHYWINFEYQGELETIGGFHLSTSVNSLLTWSPSTLDKISSSNSTRNSSTSTSMERRRSLATLLVSWETKRLERLLPAMASLLSMTLLSSETSGKSFLPNNPSSSTKYLTHNSLSCASSPKIPVENASVVWRSPDFKMPLSTCNLFHSLDFTFHYPLWTFLGLLKEVIETFKLSTSVGGRYDR